MQLPQGRSAALARSARLNGLVNTTADQAGRFQRPRRSSAQLLYPAEEAFQVARLGTGHCNRMIGGLSAALEKLHFAAVLHRKLGQESLQHRRVDQARTAARHENAVRFQQPQGLSLQLAIAT